MREDYAAAYRELYQRHWWWRAREKFILEQIRGLPGIDRRQRILDVGCGDGLFFNELMKFGDVEGIEPDAVTSNNGGAHAGRIYHVPFDEHFKPAQKYSLVLMLDVLEHLKDPVTALRRALDLLDEKGTIIVTVPAFRSLWTKHDEINFHVTRFTKTSFREVARGAQFNIHSQQYFFHWLFPLKLAERFGEWVFKAKPAVPAIPTPLLNSLFYSVSRIEQRITNQAPLPLGSSLLVIGGK